VVTVLASGYPGKAETKLRWRATAPACQLPKLKVRTTGQLGGGAGGGHCCGYIGCPPPPRGPPGPTRPYLQHFSAGMPGVGPPGSGWLIGDGGGGSSGAALTGPTPNGSVEIAIAATMTRCLTFTFVASQTSSRGLPANWGGLGRKRTTATDFG
jgi:hypothetical protein